MDGCIDGKILEPWIIHRPHPYPIAAVYSTRFGDRHVSAAIADTAGEPWFAVRN
jgi:hypothetical protein